MEWIEFTFSIPRANVCFWHKADTQEPPNNVHLRCKIGYPNKSGSQLLLIRNGRRTDGRSFETRLERSFFLDNGNRRIGAS
jgi:hypothetical protein